MREITLIVLSICFSFGLTGQTIIFQDVGGMSYANLDSDVTDEYPATPIDISNCTSVEFSVDFNFPAGWDGGGNMEPVDECCPACDADPTDPQQLECLSNMSCSGTDGCWDFMWIVFEIDGSSVAENLIGDTGTNDFDDQTGTFSFIECVDSASDAQITIVNQNWTSAEINEFTNVTIICYEGFPIIDPINPVCAGGEINLDGDAVDVNVIADWDWTTNGPANIVDPTAQNTTADGADDGDEFTLTVTDVNNCDASTDVVFISSGAFDVTMTDGDFEVCEGGCTELGISTLILDVVGGSGPYTIMFFGIPLPITFDNLDQEFQFCEGGLGFTDEGSYISVDLPSFFYPLSLTLDQGTVIDDSGCMGNLSGDTYNLNVTDPPEVEDPDIPDFCEGQLIDLTAYDDEIKNGEFGDIIWLESNDITDKISDPTQHDPDDANPVFAVLETSPCNSEIIEVPLTILPAAVITPLVISIDSCGATMELPVYDDLVTVDPAGTILSYYLDAAATDGPYSPFDIINIEDNDMIFVFANQGSVCESMMAIQVNSLPEPEIFGPAGPLEGCGTIELPDIDIDDADNVFYSTTPDPLMTGQTFLPGDDLLTSSGITTIYAIATNSNGCFDISPVAVNLLPGTDYMSDLIGNNYFCESFTLSPIMPISPDVGYFTETNGGGVKYNPGDVITFDIANAQLNVFDTLYLFDPTQTGACASEDTIIFEILEEPIFTIQDFQSCGPFTIPAFALPDSVEFSTTFNFDPGTILMSGDVITETTTVHYIASWFFTDTLFACAIIDSFDITISNDLFAGLDSTLVICRGYDETIDLWSVLGGADVQGVFSFSGIVDFEIIDSTAVDFSQVVDDTTILYSTDGGPGCPPDFATITIDIVEPRFAGINEFLDLCVGATEVFNLMELISDPSNGLSPEEGGTWAQLGGSQLIDLSDSTMVSFTGLLEGMYGYTYTLAAQRSNPYCNNESGGIIVDIDQGPNAGDTITAPICQGDNIDLLTLLSSDADLDGVFSSDDAILNGNMWDTAIPIPDTYTIKYLIETNSAACASDSIILILDLTTALSAGTADPNIEICEGEEINLNDLLTDETPGGIFVITGTTTSIPNMWTADTDQLFTYVVADNGNCLGDTEDISITVTPGIIVDFQFGTNRLCDNSEDCVPITITSNTNGEMEVAVVGSPTENSLFDTPIIDGINVINFCPGSSFSTEIVSDTFFMGSNSFVQVTLNSLSDNSLRCQDLNFSVATFPITIDTSYNVSHTDITCPGGSIMFEGVEYFASQSVAGTTVAGCDSIVDITVEFYAQPTQMITERLCIGETYFLLGTAFTMSIDELITFTGQSVDGCDSLVQLDLTFDTVAQGNLDVFICEGESTVVDGVTLDQEAIENVPAPISVFGCDSATLVNVMFHPTDTFDLPLFLCPGEDRVVEGDTYDENTQSGISTVIGGAATGCDSIINVSVILLTEPEFMLDTMICAGDQFVLGGITYDDSNLMGQSRLMGMAASGCDSLVNVNVDVQLTIMDTEAIALCFGESTMRYGVTFDANNLSQVVDIPAAIGCDTSRMVTVTIAQSAGNENVNLEFCEGQASVDFNGKTYDESNSSGLDTLRNSLGCDSILYSISLDVKVPFVTLMADNICEGELSQNIIVTDTNTDFPIEVFLNNASVGSYNDFSELAAGISGSLGTNTIRVEGASGCIVSDDIEIETEGTQSINIVSTPGLSPNDYILTVEADFTPTDIQWAPEQVLTCSTLCVTTNATITEQTEVTVNVITQAGCELNTAVVLLFDEPIIQDTTEMIYYPNIIDLNNPSNDIFFIQSRNDVLVAAMAIYDRWGNKVFLRENFMTNDKSAGWDGRYNDNMVEQGVYVYVVQFDTQGAEPNIQYGDITIFR